MQRHDGESNKFGNKIAEQAALSFDFIALLTIASILAGIGLITDNSIVIVETILVSPIMGPVLGEYIPLDKCKCAGMRWSHYCYHCHL
jgi:uncharacterized membrane protein